MRKCERGRVSFFRAIQEKKTLSFFFLSLALALPFFPPLLTLWAVTLRASPASSALPALTLWACFLKENGQRNERERKREVDFFL